MIAVSDDAPQRWAEAVGRASRKICAHFARPDMHAVPATAVERVRHNVSYVRPAANPALW